MDHRNILIVCNDKKEAKDVLETMTNISDVRWCSGDLPTVRINSITYFPNILYINKNNQMAYNSSTEFHPDAKVYTAKEYLRLNREKIVIYRNGDITVAKDTRTGKTASAKCHPDDKFDFGVGAKIALDRLMPTEGMPKYNTIQIGDKVRVIHGGAAYSTYDSWVLEHVLDVKSKFRYAYGEELANDTVGTVIAIAPHNAMPHITLAYIYVYNDKQEECYLIDITELEKIC